MSIRFESLIEKMCEAAKNAAGLSVVYGDAVSVGAALIGDNNIIYQGSYLCGSTSYASLHAEHAAIANAVSHGSRKVYSVALFVSQSHKDRIPLPCGTCLQVISDFAVTREIIIYSSNIEIFPEWNRSKLSLLLPYSWSR